MELHEVLDERLCRIGIEGRTKADVIRTLARIAAKSEKVGDIGEDVIYEKLMGREEQGTTGFGDGIAIPHTRLEGMTGFLMFIATSVRGVDFDALDHRRVSIFFVVLGPETDVTEHLKVLAAISHTISSPGTKRELINSKTPTTLYEAFLRHARSSGVESAPAEKLKAMFVVLYMEEFFYDILQFFIEQGIQGATVLESSGMGRFISNIPLFASFIGFMNEDRNSSRTIIAMIPESQIDLIVRGIDDITGGMDKREGAMVFTIDVSFYKGTMKMM